MTGLLRTLAGHPPAKFASTAAERTACTTPFRSGARQPERSKNDALREAEGVKPKPEIGGRRCFRGFCGLLAITRAV
jgi:hypothetical protein